MEVRKIVSTWRYPEASERQLSRSLSEMVKELVVFARDQLDGMRFDATTAEIDDAESSLEDYAAVLIAALVATLPALAFKIYKFNTSEFVKMAKASGGKDNPVVIMLIALGATGNENWYMDKSEEWEAIAAASFRKLANDLIADWSMNVRVQNSKGASRDLIDEIIEARYKVYTGWTVNRSRGIVATWNSLLMRQRLEDTGVTHYFWRGKLDERERLKHLRWEGKRLLVDGDHVFPGEEYGCRCWAEPDFSTTQEVTFNVS